MFRILVLAGMMIVSYVMLVEKKRGTPQPPEYEFWLDDEKLEDTEKTPREKRKTTTSKETAEGKVSTQGKAVNRKSRRQAKKASKANRKQAKKRS